MGGIRLGVILSISGVRYPARVFGGLQDLVVVICVGFVFAFFVLRVTAH